MVERPPPEREVEGSIPSGPACPDSSADRVLASEARSRAFESRSGHFQLDVAQPGSAPPWGGGTVGLNPGVRVVHLIHMKTCVACGQTKPLNEFRSQLKRGRTQIVGRCRDCDREYHRKWDREHIKQRRQGHRETSARIKVRNRTAIYDYLASHPCVDCGESDPVVLEFDHKPDAGKAANVSDMTSRRLSLAAVFREVSKCEVRCANCHRRKTAMEQGWCAPDSRYIG